MRKQKIMYPTYARSERIADGTMHGLGVVGAIGGAVYLLLGTRNAVDPALMTGLLIYAVGLMATFCASAFYHMTPWEEIRPMLRRIDHAAIYLKIAGTYTPFVMMIGTGFGYLVLAAVWVMAVIGIVTKLFFWRTPSRLGLFLYLGMGWISVFLVFSLIPVMPRHAMWLITAGGLLYTAGVVFFAWENLKFSNAIWHGFVVVGSACFYGAIAMGAVAV